MTHELKDAMAHIHCGGCGAELLPITGEMKRRTPAEYGRRLQQRMDHTLECPALAKAMGDDG